MIKFLSWYIWLLQEQEREILLEWKILFVSANFAEQQIDKTPCKIYAQKKRETNKDKDIFDK